MASTVAATRLALPSLDRALPCLRGIDDPIVRFLLTLHLEPHAEEQVIDEQRAAVFESPLIVEAFASQEPDGSWGSEGEGGRRVLSTLWMAKTLGELGVDDRHPGWHRAAEFLAAHSHTAGGVLGLDGRDTGVLSCYAGIAGEMYLLGGRVDLARAQIDWILEYQDVRVSGTSARAHPARVWDERLRTRYGGCLADTTCLIGLIKTGRALTAWNEIAPDPAVAELTTAIRSAYLERRLMYRSNGEIVPIGGGRGSPDRWLQPTFPLDWHTDLIEVLDFVARSGPPDARMQPAIDLLINAQLPDGTWPLRQSFKPRQLPAPERRSRSAGSPMITLRAARALAACS